MKGHEWKQNFLGRGIKINILQATGEHQPAAKPQSHCVRPSHVSHRENQANTLSELKSCMFNWEEISVLVWGVSPVLSKTGYYTGKKCPGLIVWLRYHLVSPNWNQYLDLNKSEIQCVGGEPGYPEPWSYLRKKNNTGRLLISATLWINHNWACCVNNSSHALI